MTATFDAIELNFKIRWAETQHRNFDLINVSVMVVDGGFIVLKQNIFFCLKDHHMFLTGFLRFIHICLWGFRCNSFMGNSAVQKKPISKPRKPHLSGHKSSSSSSREPQPKRVEEVYGALKQGLEWVLLRCFLRFSFVLSHRAFSLTHWLHELLLLRMAVMKSLCTAIVPASFWSLYHFSFCQWISRGAPNRAGKTHFPHERHEEELQTGETGYDIIGLPTHYS